MKNYRPRLLEKYNSKSLPALSEKLGMKNIMRLPKVNKIVLNMGIGEAREDKNTFKQALNELTVITGQLAIPTKSKKAISNFKIREGDVVGARVTLRKVKMYEFLDRLISIASPRIRDFRGFPSKGFDGQGNYNFGITEQIVFPEINYDKVNSIRGLNVTIVTSAQNDYEAYELLISLGFPINEYKKSKTVTKKTITKEAAPVDEAVSVEEAAPVEEATPVDDANEDNNDEKQESPPNKENN